MDALNISCLIGQLFLIVIMVRNQRSFTKANKEFSEMIKERKIENEKFWKEIEDKQN